MLALALLLQSCSAVKLGYSNITTIAYWWIDSFVGFTPEQGKRMRDDLAALQQWHRSAELPKYAELLDRMAVQAAGEVTPAQVCAVRDEIRTRLQVLAHEAEPAMAALSTTLDTDQVETLKKKYARLNAEYRRDWLDTSPEKRTQKRFDQVVDRGEMVYGRLAEAQRVQIRQYLARSSFDPQTSNAERLRRQQAVLDTLARLQADKAGTDAGRQAVARLLADGFESPDPGYRAYQRTLEKEGCEGIAAMHNAAPQEQRDMAVRRLKAYAQDARDLARP